MISVNKDAWIPKVDNYRLSNIVHSIQSSIMADLIYANNRLFKQELVVDTFLKVNVTRILRIPLTKETHDDMLVWSGEPSGEFFVRNAYKLLQKFHKDPNAYALLTNYKAFYKKIIVPKPPCKNENYNLEDILELFTYTSQHATQKVGE